ncbi:MAG: SBBP repeat-containing protein [Elainella sp. Prado103]|jgi:hypothetical protein|nr:SBBP repeat-containing protein [Elainella sp. Prado103]
MPRDIAKNTLSAAKRLNLGADSTALKGALDRSNRDDLFRIRFNERSSFDLQLDSSKGSVIGIQVFALKGNKKKILKAIGRTEFSELKPQNIKKFLKTIGAKTSANGKDGNLSLDLLPGEYYLRVRQIKGVSRYSLGLEAEPVVSALPSQPTDPGILPTDPTPRPVPIQLGTFSRRWLQQLGTSGNDYTYGTALDSGGHLYLTGVSNASGPAGDGFVAKYAADGTQLWRRSIDTPGADVGFDLVVDAGGNYYVVGATVTGSGSSTNSDAFVTKYNADGVQQWIKTIATTVQVEGVTRNALDAGLSIALDGNSLYTSGVLGAFPLPSLGKGFIAKYDATTGDAIATFGGTGRIEFGGDATAAVDLAISEGKLYTTGITGATVGLNNNGIRPVGGDGFVSAYDGNSGGQLWSQTLASEGTEQDYARSIAVFGSDVYITGQTTGTLPSGSLPANTDAGGKSDAFLARYDRQTGTLQWVKQFGTNGLEEAQAIAVDGLGRVYVVGETDKALFGGAAGKTDAWMAQYDSSGNLTASTQFGTDREDESYGVAVAADGAVYLAGQTQGTFSGLVNSGRYDGWLAQYGLLPTV